MNVISSEWYQSSKKKDYRNFLGIDKNQPKRLNRETDQQGRGKIQLRLPIYDSWSKGRSSNNQRAAFFLLPMVIGKTLLAFKSA